jgi:DNA modification methylase
MAPLTAPSARSHRLLPASLPPPWSQEATTADDCTFEQLAPYIGRIKTAIARYLVKRYTRQGDLILDPFAGSGVIPFEASLLGRRTIAADISPYGYPNAKKHGTSPFTS